MPMSQSFLQREFLDPPFTPAMLRHVVVRRGILAAVRRVLPLLSGTVLDLGCGYQPYRELFLSAPSTASKYLGMDYAGNQYLGTEVDVLWDGGHFPLMESSIDCVIATEFFEHCDSPDAVFAEIARTLKPGGLLMLTVPFLWPLHEVPHDVCRYTPFTLERKITSAGFKDVQIEALGGISAALAIMVSLWVTTRITRPMYQRVAIALALPIVRWLCYMDTPPTSFPNNTMITGLSVIARKPS